MQSLILFSDLLMAPPVLLSFYFPLAHHSLAAVPKEAGFALEGRGSRVKKYTFSALWEGDAFPV